MADTKPIRVVIVDDERLFAELMRVALRAADGIEVEGRESIAASSHSRCSRSCMTSSPRSWH